MIATITVTERRKSLDLGPDLGRDHNHDQENIDRGQKRNQD